VVYYVGPFLRARDWEATAVPELRRAVRLTVDHLLAHMTRADAGAAAPVATAAADTTDTADISGFSTER
jgi:hypothetical protein